MRDWWVLLEALAAHQDFILLYGPPGTGKSTVAQRVLEGLGYAPDNVFRVTITEETPAAELRGMFVPHEGKFKFVNGPGTEAMEFGHGLIIDEIDKACGDLFSYCLGLLNAKDISRITLPNGKTVTSHAGFRCIATMNGVPDDLPEPLRDRFAGGILCADKPHPQALERLPGYLRDAAVNSMEQQDPARKTTMRQWLAFIRLLDKVGEDVASEAVFGHRAGDVMAAVKMAQAASQVRL